jgi:serine protease AprX
MMLRMHCRLISRFLGAVVLALFLLTSTLPGQTLTLWSDVRNKDLRGYALDATAIRTLWFNGTTIWDPPAQVIAQQVLATGKNPGLGIRSLHARGITGANIRVAIIDQNLCLDHPEFNGKIVKYKDFGTGQPASQGSMHAPAVTSLLAGKEIGTAPGAIIYFAAVPSWSLDAQYYADALDWIITENALLPPNQKIRVVSISAAPSGPATPYTQHTAAYDQAYQRAVAAGLMVLDCTEHHGLIDTAYYDVTSPEDPAKARPGFPSNPGATPSCPAGHICAPNSFRTQAEEYQQSQYSFQYMGQGGLSWSVPYIAGVLALGWQVQPALSNERIWQLLLETAAVVYGCRIVNPVEFINRLQGATDIWIAHITAAGQWRTSLRVYNPGARAATFEVARFRADGLPLGRSAPSLVEPKAWTVFPAAELNYEGTANLLSAQELLVKLEFQYGSSPSVCEFFPESQLGRSWMIPNPARNWFAYTGVALVNPGASILNVTLQAWKNGSLVDQRDIPVGPGARLAMLSSQIWNNVQLGDFDTALILSPTDIPAPISITANAAEDRHLFFLARRLDR